MRAIVTVVGKDRVGIISEVCTLLAKHNVNILDISQTIVQEFFTMTMLVDVSQCSISFVELNKKLAASGEEKNLTIRAQLEEIFNSMHRI